MQKKLLFIVILITFLSPLFCINNLYAALTKEDVKEIGQIVKEYMEPRLNALEQNTKTEINALRTEIKAVEQNLQTKINSVEQNLQTEIKAVEQNLQIGIDTNKTISQILIGLIMVLIALPQIVSFFREKRESDTLKEHTSKIAVLEKTINDLKRSRH